MTERDLGQELSVIREMIEKTRRDTAESGTFFLFMGITSIIGTLLAGYLEYSGKHSLLIPAFALITIINAILGYGIIVREHRLHAVKTYAKTLFWRVWIVCGLAALAVLFLFPFLQVYPPAAIPVLICLIMGIALCLSGAIIELTFLQLSSAAWFAGSVLMAVCDGIPGFLIMAAVILSGWIVPGWILHRRCRKRG